LQFEVRPKILPPSLKKNIVMSLVTIINIVTNHLQIEISIYR
jgi:hypothetical protein